MQCFLHKLRWWVTEQTLPASEVQSQTWVILPLTPIVLTRPWPQIHLHLDLLSHRPYSVHVKPCPACRSFTAKITAVNPECDFSFLGSPPELVQLQPVLSHTVLTPPQLLLPLLSLCGSLLVQLGNLCTELAQLLLPVNDTSISVLADLIYTLCLPVPVWIYCDALKVSCGFTKSPSLHLINTVLHSKNQRGTKIQWLLVPKCYCQQKIHQQQFGKL